RLHAGLAPRVHAPLREGRRDLAGALCHGHVGGRLPSPPPRGRLVGEEGVARRGRVLRLHHARPRNGRGETDRARRHPEGDGGGAGGCRRTGARLLRQVDGTGRPAPRLRHGASGGSDGGCEPLPRRRRRRPGGGALERGRGRLTFRPSSRAAPRLRPGTGTRRPPPAVRRRGPTTTRYAGAEPPATCRRSTPPTGRPATEGAPPAPT